VKVGFCIGCLTRGFNLGPRQPFALFTAHISSYPGWVCSFAALSLPGSSRSSRSRPWIHWIALCHALAVPIIGASDAN
jgi:hypothetical protein